MILALVLLPLLAGGLAFGLPERWPQRWLLLVTAAGHFGLSVMALAGRPGPVLGGWLEGDALGLLFLGITSGLFLAVSAYAVGYLRREVRSPRADWVEGVLFSNVPERIFVGCMLLFLAAMTLVTLSQHMGLLWVAIEATTLASAPLIYFHRHHRSLEATWKYLLICSVGIALALLGTYFLAVSATTPTGESAPLLVRDLMVRGGTLSGLWLRAAFILLLVGYGTKMGLAPFHTWLPDAHSESPSLVSALMSGALLNCAFLGILRMFSVMSAAGQAPFAQGLLVLFGLMSMFVAAAFILGQSNYKRMLAYSSVEHMGILAVGIGIGGAGTFGALYHAINHSVAKGLLFLVAGNILAMYRTTGTRGVRGLLKVLPVSGVLWITGFLAITGTPPFGSFVSEFTILQAGISDGRVFVVTLYLGALALVFIGMATAVLNMAQGQPWASPVVRARESALAYGPAMALAIVALLLGLYMPPGIHNLLVDASALVGGGR